MPPEVDPAADNSVIKQMREQITNLETQVKGLPELQAKAKEADDLRKQLDDIERSKLGEIDRLKLENGELASKLKESEGDKSKIAAYEGAFEKLYGDELSVVPDEQKERVQKLSNYGTWAQRLDAIRDAKALLPAPKGGQAGTPTNPGAPGAVQQPHEPPKPVAPKEWGNYSFGQVLDPNKKANPDPTATS